jgi:hypothetical protein
MSTKDKASNRAQDAKGRVEEAAGTISGNRDLEKKGVTDQAKGETPIGDRVVAESQVGWPNRWCFLPWPSSSA